MSDTNTEQQPGNPAEETRDSGASVSAPSANHEHGAGREQRGPGAQPGAERRRRGGSAAGFFALLALLVALAAAGVSAWQAYQLRQVTSALEVDMARKLAEIETIGSDSRRLSSGARDIARDVEARLGQLEARIVGIQNDRLAMETLYQELSQSRDEWTLAEVEQILLVASQQLQLAGNVKAALAALEAADARLAKSDRPQLTALRRVIAEDIDRLKASPFVDVTGIGLKLERMIGGINDWPLAMQARPVAAERSASAAAPGWRRFADELWNDLLGLVRIERIDSPELPLIGPEQAFFLRENVKLRLLAARLALLARDQAMYQSDLAAAGQWVDRYFDMTDPGVIASVETLDQLAQSDIRVELPDVGKSLDAVRNYRLAGERPVR